MKAEKIINAKVLDQSNSKKIIQNFEDQNKKLTETVSLCESEMSQLK